MKKLLEFLFVFVLFGCMQQQKALSGEYKMIVSDKDAEITIVFDGTDFAGSSGVNRYFGNFEQSDNKIKLNVAGSTMMMGPENLMQIEQEYLQNLQQVEEFHINNDTLVLKNSKGLELKFNKL